MSYKRIPENYTPEEMLASTLPEDSLLTPNAALLIVNSAGNIALQRKDINTSCPWHVPFGQVYRPRSESDTTGSLIQSLALARVGACIGKSAQVEIEKIELLPFMSMHTPPTKHERKFWPNAHSRMYMPLVVPVLNEGVDEVPRVITTWIPPERTIEFVEENSTQSQLDGFHASETIRVLQACLTSIA
jgi:hypothetical protein